MIVLKFAAVILVWIALLWLLEQIAWWIAGKIGDFD